MFTFHRSGSGQRQLMARAARTLALAVALAATPGISRAGLIDTPVCSAHLARADHALSVASVPVEPAAGDTARSCAALHGQVRAMLEARNVYARCANGTDRTVRVGLVQATLDDTTALLDSVCPTIRADN